MKRTRMVPRPGRCKHCKGRLERIGEVLHPDCIDPWLVAYKRKLALEEERERKAKARVERAQFKARKEKLKTFSEWEDECRAIVQEIARLRDRHDGCISCHLPPTWGGQWHGSHFRSHGACTALQFHLWNIHKSCSPCNRDKGGNIHGYRPRLIEKIGADRVAWLESQNGVVKQTPEYLEYLKRFKRVMGKRLRRMKKRIEQEVSCT